MSTNTPAEQEFFKALATGDQEKIRACVANDANLLSSFDYRNFGATPLTAACFSRRSTIVQLLLELGADPNRRSDWHMGPWSPLHCALYHHDQSLVNLLLAGGAVLDVHTAAGMGDGEAVSRLLSAEPTRVNERGGDGCQPLHFADTIEVARLLLDHGAEIDGRCTDHYSTPAQYQCTCRPEVARYLLSVGAQPDIFTAITCGDDQLVERLLDVDPKLLNARITQAFFPPGSEHNVHNILTFTIGQDMTPLHAAAKANRTSIIDLLIGRGMPVDVRGGYDQGTPLHTAAWHHCVASAECLLNHRADIELRSGRLHNNTPAGWAIVSGAADVFELLMDRGAQHHPWFLDDARDACNGRFDQVSQASPQERQRILSSLTKT